MILPGTGRGLARAAGGGGGSPHGRRPETYLARNQRREMSLPEVMLWERLRNAKAGVKIRRQHPMGPYVVDFYCREALLVIEVDGVHDDGQAVVRDAARDTFLVENGCRILRIPAADILRDPNAAAETVALAASPLHHPSDGPPPRAGEEQE